MILNRLRSKYRKMTVPLPVNQYIVHISSYFPPHLGGMEKVVEKLAIMQAKSGLNVRVITSNIGAVQHSKNNLISVRRLRSFEIAHTPIMPSLLRTLLTCPSRSIFHVHVSQAGVPEVALLAAKIKRCKIIMHIHGDIGPSGTVGILLPFYKKFFLGFALRHADSVVVPTDAMKEIIVNMYKLKNRLYVVSAGVVKEFFVEKKSYSTTPKRIRLLYTGRLSIEKNVKLLIEAVDLLTNPAEFTIVGDGSLKADIEKQISLMRNNDHVVKLVGLKSQKELIEYYRRADIVLIASDYESQSLVALEAMASTAPIIFAPLPAVKYIVGDGGVQVDRTPEAFAKAITELMDDEDNRARLGKQGQLRARQFTWENTVEEFKKIYLELC